MIHDEMALAADDFRWFEYRLQFTSRPCLWLGEEGEPTLIHHVLDTFSLVFSLPSFCAIAGSTSEYCRLIKYHKPDYVVFYVVVMLCLYDTGLRRPYDITVFLAYVEISYVKCRVSHSGSLAYMVDSSESSGAG